MRGDYVRRYPDRIDMLTKNSTMITEIPGLITDPDGAVWRLSEVKVSPGPGTGPRIWRRYLRETTR